jgi:excisionase family DNA binding protein
MTMAEAGRYLRCSRAHVSNLIAGKVPAVPPLPHVRVGRRVLFLRSSIDEFLRQIETRNRELNRRACAAREDDDGII